MEPYEYQDEDAQDFGFCPTCGDPLEVDISLAGFGAVCPNCLKIQAESEMKVEI